MRHFGRSSCFRCDETTRSMFACLATTAPRTKRVKRPFCMRASIIPIHPGTRKSHGYPHMLRRIRALLWQCTSRSIRYGGHGCCGWLVADSIGGEDSYPDLHGKSFVYPCGCASLCPGCGKGKCGWETYLTKVNSSVTPCTPSNLMISRPKSGFVVRWVFVFFLYSPF